MVEFNPDGSIKLPERFEKQKKENEDKMRLQMCMKIRRELVDVSPKSCRLHLTLSDKLDERFITSIYNTFRQRAQTPTKIHKISEKEFDIEIGTDFQRCRDCNSLVGSCREYLDGNVIEDRGNCSFKGFGFYST